MKHWSISFIYTKIALNIMKWDMGLLWHGFFLVIVGFFTAMVFRSSKQWVFYENNTDMASKKKKGVSRT